MTMKTLLHFPQLRAELKTSNFNFHNLSFICFMFMRSKRQLLLGIDHEIHSNLDPIFSALTLRASKRCTFKKNSGTMWNGVTD
jgi:hypothetical protein